ncbi:MAG: twin-arginine translocation signal domain-containing protein, partial [Gammaproteobacteria bacterium]|nr:twin-arginine translocation signal domain-containing protein [Gammaproteobacteria bacterium]
MTKAKTMMPLSVSRRRFVQGLAVGGVLATFPHIVRAGSAFKDNAFTGYATELSGNV